MNEEFVKKHLDEAPKPSPAMKKLADDAAWYIIEGAQAPGVTSSREEWDEWHKAKDSMTEEEFRNWVKEKVLKRVQGQTKENT